MPSPVPEVITRYFEGDARRDIDGVVALFTDDAVVVDEGERRGVKVAGGELYAEWFPERGERVGTAGRKGPARTDPVRVFGQHRRGVGGRVGGHLGQRDSRVHAFGDLKKERSVERAGLVARGVERGDDKGVP